LNFPNSQGQVLVHPSPLLSRVLCWGFGKSSINICCLAESKYSTLSPNQNLWYIHFCLLKKSRNEQFVNYAD
jgi:hypothetical protein